MIFKKRKIISVLRSKYGILTQIAIALLATIWFSQTLAVEPLITLIAAVATLISSILSERKEYSIAIIKWDLRANRIVNFTEKNAPVTNVLRMNVMIENNTAKSILIRGYKADVTLDDQIISFKYASIGSRQDSFSKNDEIKFIASGGVKEVWLQFVEDQMDTAIDYKLISELKLILDTNVGEIGGSYPIITSTQKNQIN